ncbi:MAG: hypothetical protein VW124_24655, partial [Paracoccaceae bacterium]
IILALSLETDLHSFHIGSPAIWYIFANILMFCMAFCSLSSVASDKMQSPDRFIGFFSNVVVSNKLNQLFFVWLIGYSAQIIIQDGFPLIWVLSEDPLTYVDFGIPTFGGGMNMLRAFLACGFFMCWCAMKKIRYIFLCLFLIFSAAGLEMSRGNSMFLGLHLLFVYFFVHKFTFPRLFKLFLLSVMVVGIFGILGFLRHGRGFEILQGVNSGVIGSGTASGIFASLIVPFKNYASLPLMNLDLKIQAAPLASFIPYWTFQPMFPTIIRDLIYAPSDYGFLISDAHNVSTTFDGPIRDFGVLLSLPLMFCVYFTVSYFFLKARLGNLFFFLCMPPLYASTVLSVFSNYFFILSTILYPILVYLFLKVVSKRVPY